jgi:hypothetical protein
VLGLAGRIDLGELDGRRAVAAIGELLHADDSTVRPGDITGTATRMSEQIPPRIVVAALVSLLTDALEKEETRHLADDRLRADLRGLGTRVEAELEEQSGRRRLRLADESVGED